MMRSMRPALSLLIGSAGAAYAQPAMVQVPATANIYAAGLTSIPPGEGGTFPPSLALPAGAQCVFVTKVVGSIKRMKKATQCPTAEHCIALDYHEPEGTHLNDPDGAGAYPATSSNTGGGSISGIAAPGAGYLVGVFEPSGGPSGAAPASLDFTTGAGTTFNNLAPQIDQTFFVGDGLTGDDTGTQQSFSVPPGAASLYLGISDACGWNGAPGCYFDNVGIFTATIKTSTSPCPSTAR